MSEKMKLAQARNWGKFMLSGTAATMQKMLHSERYTLSQHEEEVITEAMENVNNLVSHWDKGTRKVLE